MLPHTAIRVDRRPSSNPIPFQDVYFIELLERDGLNVDDVNGSDSLQEEGESRWAKRVHDGAHLINGGGGCADVLGIW